jgi:hypothetical protein
MTIAMPGTRLQLDADLRSRVLDIVDAGAVDRLRSRAARQDGQERRHPE